LTFLAKGEPYRKGESGQASWKARAEIHNDIYNRCHLFPLPLVELACASSAKVRLSLT
jgi:hypothetical protein